MKFSTSIKISFITIFWWFHTLILTSKIEFIYILKILKNSNIFTQDSNNVYYIQMVELIHYKLTNAKYLMHMHKVVKKVYLNLVKPKI
jgi:hypothetical protein